jgi:probable HAF family extracellular repeat protein
LPGVYTGEIFFSINGGGVGSIYRTVTLTVTTPPAGLLQVSQGDISVSGPQLGPFLPDTFFYQLSATSGSVGYSITNWPSWLTPLSTSGTVTTSPTTVTFLVNSSAQTMAPGTYGPSAISFTNTTNGQGNTSRNATITINPIPTLQVSPSNDIAISGNVGGPFLPNTFSYTLSTNTGSVQYEILYVPSWLTASSTSGTATTAGTTVTFTVNDSAKSLPAGGYNATILFSNVTNEFNGRGSQTRFAILNVIATGTGPSFQGLGDLGYGYSLAMGVSSDGKVAVGLSNDTNGGQKAFRWAAATGMVSLGVLPGDTFSEAKGVNSDGSVIAGDSALANTYTPFRWANSTMTSLGFLSGYTSYAYGTAISSDGTTVVGSSGNGTTSQAFRWTSAGMAGLGFLAGYDLSIAQGVNSDGSVVAGFSRLINSSRTQAFRWTSAGMTGLGFLSGGESSTATGINSDGGVVVGYSWYGNSSNNQAFRWVNGSMAGLGFLPGGNQSFANAVNADASVVVGQSNGAFRWTPTDGMQSIAALLTAAGVNFAGWSLSQATGVSADGTVIVGNGNDPSGHAQGWIARLPLPAPTLQLSPTTDVSASGNQGGPFSPHTFSYQLSASSGSIDYTITNIPTWLTASSTSGTVDASGTAIIFTVNSSANSLASGTYNPLPIAFTNATNGQGNATRAATLTINGALPGSLQVTPSTGVSAAGTQGGPFSPSSFSYMLSSTSGSVGYSISGLPSWLTVSSASGTVTTAGTTISFSVDASANTLAPGSYPATVSFANTNNGNGNAARAVSLTVNTTSPPPPTCSLSASPSTINQGQSALLSWTSTNATSGTINNGIGSVSPVASGSRVTGTLTQTTTYMGTFTGPGGSVSCSATVIVTSTPQPCTLSASPSTIAPGQSAILIWTSPPNVTGGTISPGIGSVGPSGSTTVTPTQTTTYTGIFTGSGGNISCFTVLAVNVVNYTITASASPPAGGTACCNNTFSAGSTPPVTATPNSGYTFVNWTEGGTPVSTSTTYVLPPLNASHTLVANFTATSLPPTCSLTASPTSIASGQSATLSWISTNATGGTINNGIGSVIPVASGSQTVSPTTTTTYTGTFSGPGGNVNCSTTITVTPGNPALTAATHDFNGDGKSDILWRGSDGTVGMWLMNGTQYSASSFGVLPTSWTIVGQRDFNGDGKSDILWRNSDGTVGLWLMNGTQYSASSFGTIPIDWKAVGTGDFNGDGKGDILWVNTNGDVAIWLMNGTQIMSAQVIGNVPTDWSVVGTGDFNGDGKTDLLWRNTDGTVGMWLMNGTQYSASSFGVLPPSWSVFETGDFNGDGKSDILWREAGGGVGMWLMNGTQFTPSSFGILPISWTIQGANAD